MNKQSSTSRDSKETDHGSKGQGQKKGSSSTASQAKQEAKSHKKV